MLMKMLIYAIISSILTGLLSAASSNAVNETEDNFGTSEQLLGRNISSTKEKLIEIHYKPNTSNDEHDIQTEEPQMCIRQTTQLRSLPGVGWDSLKNEERINVFASNYSQCKTIIGQRGTPYLISDYVLNIAYIPAKQDLTTELFQHWNQITSKTATIMNNEADLSFEGPMGISGSFSSEFWRIKELYVKDKVMTVRVKLRYVLFDLALSESTPLHVKFQQSIANIAEFIEQGDIRTATYLIQVLVRDFGTQVVDRVKVGGLIVQDDYILQARSPDVNALIIGTAMFLGTLDTNLISLHGLNYSTTESYLNARTNTHSDIIGGEAMTAHVTFEDWVASIHTNPAVVERMGKPLHAFINPEKFPDLSVITLQYIKSEINVVIKKYYQHNTHRGCTNIKFPNFSYQANEEDESCQKNKSNYPFGGVFQVCNESKTDAGNLCSSHSVVNSLTNNFSCLDDYEAVLLHSGIVTASKTQQHCQDQCTGIWIFKTCSPQCQDQMLHSTANYDTFWCKGNMGDIGGGLAFGGVFSNTLNNPLTNALSCPNGFSQLKILEEVILCITPNLQSSIIQSNGVAFGGFFSSICGNPLADPSKQPKRQHIKENTISIVNNVDTCKTQNFWPQLCPPGYARIQMSTDVSVCIQNTYANRNFTPPSLVTLPFPDYLDDIRDESSEPRISGEWDNFLDETEIAYDTKSAVIGLSTAAILLIVFIIVSVGMYLKKRRNSTCDILPFTEEKQ